MLLDPIKIKQTEFRNRVVMPPMCMYSVFKEDGIATDFHYVHYVSRAMAGVGYIVVESTAVLPEGRITVNDLGLWSDAQKDALKRIVDGVHQSGAKIGIQLNHAGRKSRIQPNFAPSHLPYSSEFADPQALNRDQIQAIVKAFGLAAKRANDVGFDSIQIHAAHGYLIAEFVSPLANVRTDEYADGSLFIKEIISEVTKYWPKEKILEIRISGYEYDENGMTPYDWAGILNNYKGIIDLVNVSSGGMIPKQINDYPGYQIPYAKIIKEETGLTVVAGGQLSDVNLAEGALIEGDCDMVYFGRQLLKNPYFIDELLPKQYMRSRELKK